MSDQPPPDDAGLDQSPDGEDEAPRRPGLVRRHLVLTSFGALILVLSVLTGSFVWWANEQLANIPRIEAGIEVPVGKNHNEEGKPLNLLLLGTDNGDSAQSVSEDLEDGEWSEFEHRSDTIMVVHIPADRSSIQLISIPRDIWVPIEDYPSTSGHAKINAAFAYGGPSLAVQTVEEFTGLSIDHLAMIDWENFQSLTTALDGVEVYVPEAFDSGYTEWRKGWQNLDGERALQYVRTRTNLPGDKDGDFGRIARQQNFLRAVMKELVSSSTTRNPVRFVNVLKSTSQYMTVDNTWDSDEMRDLAWSLRDSRPNDIDFVTVPFGRYGESSDGQSIVIPDRQATKALFSSVASDDVDTYLASHPRDRLPGETRIN